MTVTQWRTLFGIVAAVCAFLLTQSDVVMPPWAKLILGAISVAVAVARAPESAEGGE